MKALTAAFFAAVLVAAPRIAAAATYWVAPDGDDAKAGSAAAPFRNVQKAADVVAPGDVVVVRPGTYGSPRAGGGGYIVTSNRGGTSGAWVTFRSEIPGKAILDGAGKASHGWVLLAGASYVRIEGFEVRSTTDAGFHSNAGAHDVHYVRNHIHHVGRECTDTTSGKTGFYQGSGSAKHVYDGNVIHDVGRFAPGENGCNPETEYFENHDHGFYLNAGEIELVNNVVYGIRRGWVIHVYGAGDKHDIHIAYNTFVGANPYRDGHVLITPGTSNVVIENNVFASPRAAPVANNACSAIQGVTVRNNLTDAPSLLAGPPCGFAAANNRLSTDPAFVAPATFDFRLRPESIAIDAVPAGAAGPAHDATGAPRPQGNGFDLGAYEHDVASLDGGTMPEGFGGSGATAGDPEADHVSTTAATPSAAAPGADDGGCAASRLAHAPRGAVRIGSIGLAAACLASRRRMARRSHRR